MPVKRLLLLPGKGDVIICTFILLSLVLTAEPVSSAGVSCVQSGWSTANYFSPSPSLFYKSLPSTYFPSFSLVLLSNFHLLSLQFTVANSAAEVVLISQDPIQKPVLNKTDPLLKAGIGRGGNASGHYDDDRNYMNRRTPVYTNSTSVATRSSNKKFNSSTLVNVSFSGGTSANSSDISRQLITGRTTFSPSSPPPSDTKRPTLGKLETAGIRKASNESAQASSSSTLNSTGRKRARRPKLLKEITLFNRQNCLAKLLCGVQVAQPPTKSSSALNDYAYLVKAFFDRFSIRGIVTDVVDAAFAYEQDALEALDDEADEEEDDTSSERRKKKKNRTKAASSGGAAAHKPRKPQYHKYNPKYYNQYDKDVDELDFEELVDDDIPEFMQPDLLRRRVGRNMTYVKPFRLGGNGTSGNLTVVRRRRRSSIVVPQDINRIRKKRGIVGDVKRGFMGFFNPRFDKTAYLDKRQLELENTDSQTRQLNIAEEIAARIRSPRQCRLLNWFGNSNKNDNQNPNSPNGMTTTITTITNTGGMMSNLDKMGTLPNLPQVAVPASSATNPGSQVVTVIQQSPTGAQNGATATASPVTTSSSPSGASAMLQNMGQKASNVMSQASDVASHIGSTICPFNVQELQELILKAQAAPFPHFLTTTPANRVVPAQLFQPVVQAPAVPITTSSTLTTTLHATQAPPPPATTLAIISGSNNKKPGSSRHDPASFFQLYGDFPPMPTPPNPHYSSFYHSHTEAYPSPIYPSPPYPTPIFSPHLKDSSRVHKQTRRPAVVPSVGIAGEDDEGEFDDDPYVVYEKFGSNQKILPGLRKKQKPTPKWMTSTTPASSDDDYYSYNQALPNYSYGQSDSSYKVTHSTPNPVQTTQATVQNYIRQFHQPPVVYDSSNKKRFPHRGFPQPQSLQSQKQQIASMKPITKVKPQNERTPPPSDEKNSEEDGSDSSDESSEQDTNDDEESEEDGSTSSGSGEIRSTFGIKPKQAPPQLRMPSKPMIPAASQSVEGSEEDDNSNEAQEQREGTRRGEEDEDSEEDDDENDGKRSYERNDFSKDRGGPQAQSQGLSQTARPAGGYNAIVGDESISTSSSGFFSNFFNSLSSFSSLFNKESNSKNNYGGFTNFKSPPSPSPLPPRPFVRPYNSNWGSAQEESEEPDENDNEDDDSNEDEVSEKPTPKKKKQTSIPKPKPTKKTWPKPQHPVLEATQIPVVIEESSSWANPFKDPGPTINSRSGYSSEDDSGQEDLRENPVESYKEAMLRKNKNIEKLTAAISKQTQRGNQQQVDIDLTKYFSGLPVDTPWFGVGEKNPPEKKRKPGREKKVTIRKKSQIIYDSTEYNNESTESDEIDSPPKRKYRQPIPPPPFIIPEPID